MCRRGYCVQLKLLRASNVPSQGTHWHRTRENLFSSESARFLTLAVGDVESSRLSGEGTRNIVTASSRGPLKLGDSKKKVVVNFIAVIKVVSSRRSRGSRNEKEG